MFMCVHTGMPSGGQGMAWVICSPFPPYFIFLLFLTSIFILNGFIVFVVFDFCMYSRLAGPLDSGDSFSVS